MRSKVFKEVLLLISLLLGAFLLRERPGQLEAIPTSLKNSANNSVQEPPLFNFSVQRDGLSGLGETERVRDEKVHLAKRNPFAPEGSYSDVPLPENPYTLIAIFQGNPKRALIRIFTGEIITIKEGDLLIDGAKVLKIKEKSVVVTKLGKKYEFQLFNIEVKKWQIKK